MKKLLILLMFIVFLAQPCLATLDPSIDNKHTWKHAYRFTGKPKDLFTDWCEAVEDALDGSDGLTFMYFIPGTDPGDGEGRLYYDSSANALLLEVDGAGTWETVDTDSGSSLDTSYGLGHAVTVDDGAIALTATDAAGNVVLAIDQLDTGALNALTITGDATAALVDFDQNGTGGDIAGSDDSWTISKTGAFVINGSLTFSTADILFDGTSASEDIQYDTSANLLHFLDAAALGFGGAANGAADVSMEYEGTGDTLDITGDGKTIEIGATNAGLDILVWGQTGNSWLSDEDNDRIFFEDWALRINEGSVIELTDSANAVDWTIKSATAEQLEFLPTETTDDQKIHFGNATNTTDIRIYGKETDEGIFFDSSGAVWNFGFASDTGVDVVFWGDTASQKAWWDCSGDQWYFGADAEGVDVTFYTDTTGQDLTLDETIHSLVSDDVDIKLDDDAILFFGLGTNLTTADGDFSMNFTDGSPGLLTLSATANVDDGFVIGDATNATDILINNTTTALAVIRWDDSAETWYWGADNTGIDSVWYGDGTGNDLTFDESIDSLVSEDIDIKLDDDAILFFGTGTNVTTADGDFKINFTDATPGHLTLTATVAEDVFQIGDGTIATDLIIQNTTTATADVIWDDSGELWKFGIDNFGVDVGFYGDTASAVILFDESQDLFSVTNIDVKLDDAAVLFFGTKTNMQTADGDFKAAWVSDTRMNLTAVVANSDIFIGDGTVATDFHIDNITVATADPRWIQADDTANGVWYWGVDDKGVDVYWYGAAANAVVNWDTSADDWMFGKNDYNVDVWFYGAEASDYIQWDGDLNTYGALKFEDVTIQMQDDTQITFGDDRDITIEYDENGNDNLQISGPVHHETTYTRFDHIPMFSNWQPAATGFTWGGAAVGATGDENVMKFNDASFIYHILGAGQTELGPQMRAGGFDMSMDEGDNEGVEICGAEPIVGGGKDNFTVGTDAFYLKVKIYVTDIDGTDDLWVGFRKVGAFQTGIDAYDTCAAIGVAAAAGDFNTHTELNGGVHTETDVTDAGGDWADTTAHTLEVFVSAAKAVTYKIDGDEPTGVAAFEWTDADKVVPFIFMLHTAAGAELTYLQSYECGLQ